MPNSRRGVASGLLISLLVMVSGMLLVVTPAAACSNGPSQPPSGPGCGPNPVTVSIEIPTNAAGASLAMVRFNGTLYANGSTLPQLISGYNYTFSVVDIAAGYSLDHWADNNATIIGANNQTAVIVFCRSSLGQWFSCGTTTLALELAAADHSVFSGQAFEATAVHSISTSFVVPTPTWYQLPGNVTNPLAGRYQLVDWGVGFGGVSGSAALVAGLQINFTSLGQGKFNPIFTPFYSTSTKSLGGQTSLPLSAGKKAAVGDTINVSMTTQNCSNPRLGLVAIQFFDVTNHGSASAYGSCPGSSVPTTGEWMVWDPLNGSGVLSPSYRNGLFTNLTFNGKLLYPRLLSSPPLGCQLLAPPYLNWCPSPSSGPVNFVEWANAASGWNESLNPGLVTYPTGIHGGALYPFVATLANVLADIYPTYFGNTSREMELMVNGELLPNGVVTLLQYGAFASLNVSGDHSGSGYTQAFVKWGTSAGNLTNSSRQGTTINISQPGRLEALIQIVGSVGSFLPGSAGYSNTSLAHINNLTARFLLPQTTFNASTASPHHPEILQIGVGMLTLGEAWMAGLQIQYSNSTSIRVSTFYELAGRGGTFGTGYFVATAGDQIVVNITSANITACGSAQQLCWTISDLSHLNLSNQTGASHHFEEWTGGTPPLNSLPFGTDWWFAGPPDPAMNSCLFSSLCGTPKLSLPLNFTGLEVDGKATALFGPYEVTSAILTAPTGLIEKLLPNFVCLPTGRSFTITQG